jgi:RNA polymerase sigma factor (sigma-70 family)
VRYQRLIYSIPLRYGLPEQDANDIFQDVSILLLRNLARVRDRQRLGAWLTITTRRECWRMMRQKQHSQLPSEADTPQPPISSAPPSEEEFLALEMQSVIRAAVDHLGNPCQKLLKLLFYAEPRPAYTEIARQLGVAEGSIGPTRARCLKKAVKILQKMGFVEA